MAVCECVCGCVCKLLCALARTKTRVTRSRNLIALHPGEFSVKTTLKSETEKRDAPNATHIRRTRDTHTHRICIYIYIYQHTQQANDYYYYYQRARFETRTAPAACRWHCDPNTPAIRSRVRSAAYSSTCWPRFVWRCGLKLENRRRERETVFANVKDMHTISGMS